MVRTSVSPRRRAAESALRGRRVAVFSCALYCVILSCCSVMSGIWAQTSVGTANEDERRLIYDLFKNYNKIIRPAKDPNETLSVGFQQAMIQVISISEREQLMKTNNWLRFEWMDMQLTWDPADYGGVDVLRIPSDEVWSPEIVLLNNADGVFDISFPCKVLVYPSGYVLWVPCSIFQSSCSIDVLYFPFDEQTCEMIFGSWTYNSKQVNLYWYDAATSGCEGNDLCYSDLGSYVRSGSWDIIAAPSRINQRDSGYTDISSFFVIRRKTSYYIINLVIPCVVISSLSLFVFYLPPDEGEKLGLVMAILLGLMVFLLLVSAILPTTSDAVPLLSKYLLFTFLINVLVVVYTVIIINFNLSSPTFEVMPYWIKLLFLRWFPRLIFFKRPPDPTPGSRTDGGRFDDPDYEPPASVSSSIHRSVGYGTPIKKQSTADLGLWADAGSSGRNWSDFYIEKDEFTGMTTPNGSHFGRPRNASLTGSDVMRSSGAQPNHIPYPPEFIKAEDNLRFIANNLMDTDNFNNTIEDWKYIALVFDRLLLYIFTVATVVGTLFLLLNQPFVLDSIDQREVLDKFSETHQKNMKNADFISSCTGFDKDIRDGLDDETSYWIEQKSWF